LTDGAVVITGLGSPW